MRRALYLALNGEGRVSPNPMVGAVIVANDKIIGEGYHAYYGGPHAEVNAVNSVKDSCRHLLKQATMYVTLEPCAHYGKTPPCAELLVKIGIPRVVIAACDPNPLVAGKGIKILEDAGIEVHTGLLKDISEDINRRFIKAHTYTTPWIILKWAQSRNGFMASFDDVGHPVPVKLSSSLSSVWMHRERAKVDAIMVGTNTKRIDRPKLNVRFWGGNSPKIVEADSTKTCKKFAEDLRREGITSLMVEGGPALLSSFISEEVYDEIRVETSTGIIDKGILAPQLPSGLMLVDSFICRGNLINVYRR